MKYIVFDTNIWVFSLSDSWKVDNKIDYLEYWIESNQVKILLPEIIRDEWNLQKDKRAEERRKKLVDFFNMAEEILPTEYFKEYTTPDAQGKIVKEQLDRINKVIDTAEWVPISDDIKNRVIENGIKKNAPMHKKSSIADAIIIYSLFEFARNNPEDDYFFVSDNKDDFFEKVNNKIIIHRDLKPDFDRLKIRYYRTFNHLRIDLEKIFNLSLDFDFEEKRKQAIKNRIKKQIYNPHYESLAKKNTSELFSQNKKMLDYILEEYIPTKEQVIFVLSLIDSDNDYEKYFYGKVRGKAWFNILLQKGIYKAKNIPVNSEFWIPLNFLQNLATEETDNTILSKIIDIIKDVSEKSHNNPNTWWSFISILLKMPSKNIPIDIFVHIPKWIKNDESYDFIVRQLSDKLIPKLFNETPKVQNKKKIVVILKYLLEISKRENTGKESYSFNSGFYTPIKELTHIFNNKLISIIVSNCPKEIIAQLINSLKLIYYTFPNGLVFQAKKGNANININLSVNTIQKKIEVFPENGNEFAISNFDKLSEIKLREQLIDKLSKQGLVIGISEDEVGIFESAIQHLTIGLSFLYGNYGIEEYESRHNSESVEFAFVIILLKIINKYVKEKPDEGLFLISEIFKKEEYKLAVLRQICLFVIGDNWEITRGLFFEKLQNGQITKFFYESRFQTDLFRFLKKKQFDFDDDTLHVFDEIINNPTQLERHENLEKWQLRWYSSLKETKVFRKKYEELSKRLKYGYEYYNTVGRLQTFSGERSPISVDDLLKKSNSEIVNYIDKFKPTREFAAPSVSGLGKSLEAAVKQNPKRFSENINDFIYLPYIYVYYIIYGFYYAWEEKKTFNWAKVLDFCLKYVSNEKFYTKRLQTEDDLRADADWVIGVISNLLQEGMRSDEHSMGLALLPKSKEILMILSRYIKPDIVNKPINDYPSYTLNSTAGKILRGLFDYSLNNARNNLKNAEVKWEREIVDIFEKSLELKVIDSYILIGMYYRQFLFLDSSWTESYSISFQSLTDEYWKAFWSGYLFSGYVPGKQDYPRYIAHYERAILNIEDGSYLHGDGIKHHITSFYFWEYEDLSDNGLVAKFCKNANPESIIDFVNYMSNQNEYLRLLKSDEEKNKFEERIIVLWGFLINRFKKVKDDKEQKVLSNLCKLVSLIQELNKSITKMILVSSSIIEKSRSTFALLKNLSRLCKSGSPKNTAEYVGEIIASIPIRSFSFYENEEIKDIMVFLFENEQKQIALKFCDDRLRLGDESFNELIDRYK